MEIGAVFFFNSILLGVGLAMDAFSVSLANGLQDAGMKKGRMCQIAGVFAFFQALMPMVGWFCIHTIVNMFQVFERLIPWIALLLLVYIGGSMIKEGRSGGEVAERKAELGWGTLLIQGIATSIDALSVGFTIAEDPLREALTAAVIIAAVTFIVCLAGLQLGKRMGTRLAGKAGILGGSILIFIGVEIFLTGILG